MSDYVMKLPYVRFVRQVSGESKALTQWKVSMKEILEALKVAVWQQSDKDPTLVTMPVNTPLTFTLSHAYDSFKMSSTVAQSGKQTCHMGMSAYRFKIPSDANSGDKRIKSITFTLGADKFNVKGLKVSAYFSDTATPPTDWATCRAGNVATEDLTTNGVSHGVLPSLETSVSASANKSGEYTLSLTQSIDYNYVYLIITNWDYEDYRATREYYIDGSGVINGPTVSVTFEATSVTPDASSFTNTGVYVPITSLNFGETFATPLTEANAIIKSATMYALYPGAFNSISDASADVKLGAYITAGYYASAVGALMRGNVKTTSVPYRTLSFGSGFTVDLTSKDFSVIGNLWVGVPLVASNDYVDYDSIDATNDAAIFSQLAYGTGSLTLKVVKSGLTTPTLAMKNVGQFMMYAGKSYDNSSIFPVNLSNTDGTVLTALLVLAPIGVNTISTTSYVNIKLDVPIYFN